MAVFGFTEYGYGIAIEDTIQNETTLQHQALCRLFQRYSQLEKRVEQLEKK